MDRVPGAKDSTLSSTIGDLTLGTLNVQNPFKRKGGCDEDEEDIVGNRWSYFSF